MKVLAQGLSPGNLAPRICGEGERQASDPTITSDTVQTQKVSNTWF